MRPRISIRGCVRRSVRRSVRPSVRNAFSQTPDRRILRRVFSLVKIMTTVVKTYCSFSCLNSTYQKNLRYRKKSAKVRHSPDSVVFLAPSFHLSGVMTRPNFFSHFSQTMLRCFVQRVESMCGSRIINFLIQHRGSDFALQMSVPSSVTRVTRPTRNESQFMRPNLKTDNRQKWGVD